MKNKINFIKNMFNTIFPYELSFRIIFFNYLEKQLDKSEEENLEIIGSLLQILQNQKTYEKKQLIETISKSLREKGILLDISND